MQFQGGVREAGGATGGDAGHDSGIGASTRENAGGGGGSNNGGGVSVCTAMYDYEAHGDDELTLKCGDIIEVLSQDVNISGDEGWWTGKINGKVSKSRYLGLNKLS